MRSRRSTKKDVLLGQYTAGKDKDGKEKPGYLDDETVPKGSHCPTFAAMTLWINNPDGRVSLDHEGRQG